jgi:cell wall assembly regulator SMI1
MNCDKNLGNLFYGMNFLPLERVVAEFSQDASTKAELGSAYTPDAAEGADRGIKTQDMHNGGWIPLAHNWGDTLIRVDMDPAAGGHRGQVIFTDHAYGVAILLAPGVGQFLAGFADDLESGRYSLKDEALEDGNEFLECAAEVDLANWWKSPRWEHLQR